MIPDLKRGRLPLNINQVSLQPKSGKVLLVLLENGSIVNTCHATLVEIERKCSRHQAESAVLQAWAMTDESEGDHGLLHCPYLEVPFILNISELSSDDYRNKPRFRVYGSAEITPSIQA